MGYPTFRFRRMPSGEIEAIIFDSDELPTGDGWTDSPAKCVAPAEQPAPPEAAPDGAVAAPPIPNLPKKRGLPRKEDRR